MGCHHSKHRCNSGAGPQTAALFEQYRKPPGRGADRPLLGQGNRHEMDFHLRRDRRHTESVTRRPGGPDRLNWSALPFRPTIVGRCSWNAGPAAGLGRSLYILHTAPFRRATETPGSRSIPESFRRLTPLPGFRGPVSNRAGPIQGMVSSTRRPHAPAHTDSLVNSPAIGNVHTPENIEQNKSAVGG